MRRLFLAALATFFASGGAFASTQQPERLEVKSFRLSNGMEVWVNEDHSLPTVMGMVVVKAGAKDCPDTGIAHYFEHIMFKGTDRIGTVDYDAEKPILDSIAEQYSLLKGTADLAERKVIQSRINALSISAARYAVPNEFSNLITMFGGSGLNAGTGQDYTMYFNIFSSQNIIPWLELNSERLLNPVFRLFQSELETVYEEKNMYSDNIASSVMEKAMELICDPHPYSKPILGSTESLKNLDLGAMKEFYEEYYVAGNMALILSGDIDTEAILPHIEKYFSRIPEGAPAKKEADAPRWFSGRQAETIKVPIPLLKGGVTVWKGVAANDPDEAALNIMVTLLSNENMTGHLDRLGKAKKVMFAGALNSEMNDGGILGAFYVPRSLMFGLRGAEKKVLEVIESLKRGEFTDEEFENAKTEYLKNKELLVENNVSRVYTMAGAYSTGISWEEYMEKEARVRSLTRDDIIRVANDYLGGDRLALEKKTGSYPKDNLPKPGFAPIQPQRDVKYSEYARNLIAEHAKIARPRFIDLQNDLEIVTLSRSDTLMRVENPYNDIFRLKLNYPIGYRTVPSARLLPEYLEFAGTDSLSNIEFQEALRRLGAAVWYSCASDEFTITLEGLDENFAETYSLLIHFIENATDSKEGLKSIHSSEKLSARTVRKDNSSMHMAAFRYSVQGERSRDLNEMSAKEIKRYPKGKFIQDFRQICEFSPTVYYSGTKDAAALSAVLERGLPGAGGEKRGREFYPFMRRDDRQAFVYDMPKVRQTIIGAVVILGDIDDPRERHLAQLFNMYVGGSMNSVMFQEIREYRSFAYSASSTLFLPDLLHESKDAVFYAQMTTQTDKTADAVATLDSLLRNMEFTEERLQQAKVQMINDMNNNYPSFRNLPATVAEFFKEGYTQDPNAGLYDDVAGFTTDDLAEFHEKHFRPYGISWIITSDLKALGKPALDEFGKVVELKEKDIVKK